MEITKLEENCYYHIYNRGVNGGDLFFNNENYDFFIEQFKKYCSAVLDVYAFALLKNHFHFVVYVKPNIVVQREDGKGEIKLNSSKQLGHLFNSYAQHINFKQKRTGGLLESPFERVKITNDKYFTNSILYCNYNAVKHGFVTNIKDWSYTSYNHIINDNTSIVAIDKVLQWFGGMNSFINAHKEKVLADFEKSFLLEKEN